MGMKISTYRVFVRHKEGPSNPPCDLSVTLKGGKKEKQDRSELGQDED
jgi:hypothetical protein